MNERVKELALQAGYKKDMFGVGHWDMPECKKFAELIVRECVNQCEQNIVGMVGSHANTHNSAVQKCMNSVTEHFGF
jgi:hypothetical protein